jgi:hypothetical protein
MAAPLVGFATGVNNQPVDALSASIAALRMRDE